ncbi:potassium transporter TrkA [Mycobacterium sp. 852002-51163_SCH5372311]|uniref:NAD-binding protein n=1 Tax=Mycobacterium sp. 852002-51163_SCH5372311 TaxID=1834097 RepID=UPI0007FF25B5|nr:NAD-binding protein [Mycobacterium sp. 852002-51163_SCH5372311]OBF85365.1 potassium transporter TrkA [Mycobacterium sp. 852002-51163_SCH5372311]
MVHDRLDRHIIVSGDDALATTIVEELNKAGARIVRLADAELADAGVATACAVVCAGADDAKNLEIALLARKANPEVRVVARLANDVLRTAMAADNGPGAILDVADLSAPSVVEACLASTTHPFEAAGINFVVWGTEAPRDATLRDLYGDLAPAAVIRGENSAAPGDVVACPGRDLRVHAGDWTAMIGTADQLAACGVKVPGRVGTRAGRPRLRRVLDAARTVRQDVNPAFYPASVVGVVLLIGSTIVLRFSYLRHPGITWLDALYFSAETITTVGYGDFSFAQQPTWLRLFSVMLMFVGMTTTALLVAFIADLLLSRRFTHSAGRRRVRHLRNHVIVVGLGSLGIRVVSDLTAAGYDAAVIENDDDNPFLPVAADLDVPVIFGDATLRQTLESAGIDRARAVAVLTQDDMVNIETGIVLSEMYGPDVMPELQRPDVPIVLRVYDRDLGFAVAQRFGFENVRSAVELSAPWFIGAAMGLQVLGTFSVGQSSFMIGTMFVEAGSELDGLTMFEMSTQTRVIAITREDQPVRLHPRRDTRLRAGDTAYLVGPYRELLDTLRKGQRREHSVGSGSFERLRKL